jgi:hypothetical protein
VTVNEMNHAVYLLNEGQDAGATTPTASSPQPKAYATADATAESGARQNQDKGSIGRTDVLADPTLETSSATEPSPSVAPPSGNSLQFKKIQRRQLL